MAFTDVLSVHSLHTHPPLSASLSLSLLLFTYMVLCLVPCTVPVYTYRAFHLENISFHSTYRGLLPPLLIIDIGESKAAKTYLPTFGFRRMYSAMITCMIWMCNEEKCSIKWYVVWNPCINTQIRSFKAMFEHELIISWWCDGVYTAIITYNTLIIICETFMIKTY